LVESHQSENTRSFARLRRSSHLLTLHRRVTLSRTLDRSKDTARLADPASLRVALTLRVGFVKFPRLCPSIFQTESRHIGYYNATSVQNIIVVSPQRRSTTILGVVHTRFHCPNTSLICLTAILSQRSQINTVTKFLL